MTKLVNFFTVSLLTFLFFSCSSHGPVGKPEFLPTVQKSLPIEDGEVLYSGTVAFFPDANWNQSIRDRASLINLDWPSQISGVVAVTNNSIWILQWNGSKKDYRIIRRFKIDDLKDVEFDKLINSTCIILTKEDYSVSSFHLTSAGGNIISSSKTLECYNTIEKAIMAKKTSK